MKRSVTVVPADNMILVDGVAREIAFSVSPAVRALQWHGEDGHVEYADGSHRDLSMDLYDHYMAPFVALWESGLPLDVNKTQKNGLGKALGLKEQEIREKADEAIKLAKACYSFCEESTWPMQEAGARSLCDSERLVQNSLSSFILTQEPLRKEAVALVEKLADDRHVPALVLAEAIIIKADRFAKYSELIFSEQREFTQSLREIEALDEVDKCKQALQELNVVYTDYNDFELPQLNRVADDSL